MTDDDLPFISFLAMVCNDEKLLTKVNKKTRKYYSEPQWLGPFSVPNDYVSYAESDGMDCRRNSCNVCTDCSTSLDDGQCFSVDATMTDLDNHIQGSYIEQVPLVSSSFLADG